MTPQIITLIILLVAIILLVSEKFPPDAITLGVMVALGISGVLSIPEALSGFGRSTIITLIAMFILARGLKLAGWTDQMAGVIVQVAGGTEVQLILVIMLVGAFLSLFMNDIAAAVVLLPVVVSVAARGKTSPSRLLLPLSIGIELGGSATIFTTTNLVTSGILVDNGFKGFGLLDYLPIGMVLVIFGISYLLLVGRKKLPETNINQLPAEKVVENLIKTYRLGERVILVRVLSCSPLAGKSLAECGLRQEFKLNLLAIQRNGVLLRLPSPDSILQQGDVLVLVGRYDEIDWQEYQDVLEVVSLGGWDLNLLQTNELVLTEAVMAPRSELIGKTIKSSHFREKYGVLVLGIWRNGNPIRSELENRTIQFGDGLLLYGSVEKFKILSSDPDLILLRNPEIENGRAKRLSWLALTIFVVAVVLSIVFDSHLSLILMGGSLLMVFTGIVSMDQVYKAVEWRTVFVVAGMLPLGTAIVKSGLAENVVGILDPIAKLVHPYAAYIVLFIFTFLFSQVIHDAVVSSIMVPLGIQLGVANGLDPRALAMGLALVTSMTFGTPYGHPVSMLVMAPGNYRFKDYVRIGMPLAILVSIVILLILPLFWPLR